jgi:outer membrane protein assembly factor BamB
MRRSLGLALFILHFALFTPANAGDWVHWRGPEQNGYSKEKNLPDSFDLNAGAKGNVIWKAPFGGRSAPLVLKGKIYCMQGTGPNLGLHEGEQIVCLDEKTGKELWKYRVNVFHSDIVSSRLGWAPLTADPETGNVYAHTTGGLLLCLSPEGKLVWQRSLTEEFGRVTGYGGRIPAPIFDSGLVIAPMVNSSWGDMARSASRFVAFDGKTGQVVWLHDPGYPIKDTYYSNPVIAVINGQRLLISGGSDGYLHALKVRTGERVWSYRFCAAAVNGSPIVDGNLVYCSHGDENPEPGAYGRIVCVDAGQIDPKTKEPKLVWDFTGVRFGLGSMALADGRLYAPADTGALYCFNAKTGKRLWQFPYAREVRGSPLVADGKLYIMDVQQRFWILKLNGDRAPDELESFDYRIRESGGSYAETNGTPIAVNGRLYFNTGAALYCIGDPDAKPTEVKYKPLGEEAKFDPNASPVAARVFPAEVTAKPGQTLKLTLKLLDANGRELTTSPAGVDWALPAPPPPKGAAGGPPPLRAKLEGSGTEVSVVLEKVPSQQGWVRAAFEALVATARVRVAPELPYQQNFDALPAGGSPGGWVNANGKFVIVDQNGNKVLSKVNTNPVPPVAKANAYVTLPDATGYTVQCDVMATQVRGGMPDLGLVNCRYTLILDGKIDPDKNKRTLRLNSWENRPRINYGIEFDWQPGTWYTAKLAVEQREKSAVVRGKVWKKGEKEPDKWTIEFEDPSPNREGSGGLYGYVSNITQTADGQIEPGSDIFYDNLIITLDAKK